MIENNPIYDVANNRVRLLVYFDHGRALDGSKPGAVAHLYDDAHPANRPARDVGGVPRVYPNELHMVCGQRHHVARVNLARPTLGLLVGDSENKMPICPQCASGLIMRMVVAELQNGGWHLVFNRVTAGAGIGQSLCGAHVAAITNTQFGNDAAGWRVHQRANMLFEETRHMCRDCMAVAARMGACGWCGGYMTYDPGHAASRIEPAQPPVYVCDNCGLEVD